MKTEKIAVGEDRQSFKEVAVNSDSRSRRLAAYAAAAGAATLGVTGTASAVVISDPDNDAPIDIAPGFFQALDVDQDGTNDILLNNFTFINGPYMGATIAFPGGTLAATNQGLNYATLLNEGDLIDSSTLSSGISIASLAYGAQNPNAEFNSVNGGYIGFSFASGGEILNGWVQVTIDQPTNFFRIDNFAYESEAGVGITAGTIPEPASLALLALGAAGVAGYRGKRESVA